MSNCRHPWGVTYNKTLVDAMQRQYRPIDVRRLEDLDREMLDYYDGQKGTDEDRELRSDIVKWLQAVIADVYPDGYLICGGSTVSGCGTVSSDMDLCYVLKTSSSIYEVSTSRPVLPIKMYQELDVNRYILNRIASVLHGVHGISKIQLVPANVPIVKMVLDTAVLPHQSTSIKMEIDINCNCVAGIYNSFLLGGLVAFDDRLAVLSVILKKWGKNVKVVDEKRFNSYALVLLIVHYLQCGVDPPVLPNLMELSPNFYDGTIEPKDLQVSLIELDDSVYDQPINNKSVAELLVGFFRYYSLFDMQRNGIRIKTGEVCQINFSDPPAGHWSNFFLEEPYDEITVPKNLKNECDFKHIYNEFEEMAMKMEREPRLEVLFGKVNNYRSKRMQRRAEEEEEVRGSDDEQAEFEARL